MNKQQRAEFIRRASFISEADRDMRAAFVDEIAQAAAPQPHSASDECILFPVHLRKMWSGGEVQAWLDEYLGLPAQIPSTAKGSLERYRQWQAAQAVPSPGIDAAGQKPVPLNVIREWPDGLAEMVDATMLDTIGYTVNYRLYDLQQALAKFGFNMTVTEAAPSPAASADEWMAEAERLVEVHGDALHDARDDPGSRWKPDAAIASRAALLAHLKARP